METDYGESKEKRPRVELLNSVRVTLRRFFSKWINEQGWDCQEEMDRIREKQQELEDLIDVVAQEAARQRRKKADDEAAK
jgi:hypothetical protein